MLELDEFLEHEGVKRRSGRYEYGSGKVPYQHEPWFKKGIVPSDKTAFYARYRAMKKDGYSDKDIAQSINEELYNGEKDYRGNDKFNTTKLREWVMIGKEQQTAENITRAIHYRYERQMSLQAIADKFDTNESTIRSWLEPGRIERMNKTRAVADMIKEAVDAKGYLDVGKSLEIQLSLAQKDSEKMITRTSTDAALEWLCSEGYKISNIKTELAQSPGKFNEIKVLTKDDVPYKEIVTNKDRIRPFTEYFSPDGENFYKTPDKPRSVDSKRIDIVYAEDGGIEKDGVIELRPGVKDISLGNNQYAQVRIAVDDTHYLKGMAIYNNNLPDGVDIRFNTNKTKDIPLKGPTSDTSVLKPFKLNGDGEFKDPDNPFGAVTKPNEPYKDKDGNDVPSCVNKVNEDEDWAKWSKNLPSQFLAKQDKGLAKRQLAIEYSRREQEYEDISNLVNPTLKKKLLMDFADEMASDANHLKAAPLPGQATKVILPVPSLKDNEVYAPTLKQGEEVILVRFPHQGTFEIPRLKVNNRNKEAKENLGTAENAIGINGKVASQLSGADFDGDTVIAIPVRGQSLRNDKPLDGLKNFEPKVVYKRAPNDPIRTAINDSFDTQMQMGKITNLVTDMTIAGAPMSDIEKAVKHAQVVIDAEKHNLDWKRSEQENEIAKLKARYQPKPNGGPAGGASTLISQANADAYVKKRKEITNTKIMTPEELADFKAGYKVYRETGERYIKPQVYDPEKKKWVSNTKLMTDEQKQQYYKDRNTLNKAVKEYMRTGKEYDIPTAPEGVRYKVEDSKEKVSRMSNTRDARTLISDHNSIIENIYADHANKLKALELKARAEARVTPGIKKDPLAAKKYAEEVASLKRKLILAESYSPMERQAQNLTEAQLKVWKANTFPEPTKEEIKKKKFKLLAQNRDAVGSKKKDKFTITDKEWEAIQANAIANSTMEQILSKADQDQIRKLATPKKTQKINKVQLNRAKTMIKAGYTQADVADMLGISVSTLSKFLNEN